MSSPLQSLPHELLQKILLFAAEDTQTLLNCEAACVALRQTVQDDKTWARMPNIERWKEDDRLTSNRMKACTSTVLYSILNEHCKEKDPTEPNVLLEELGAEGWKLLITTTLASLAPNVSPSFSLNHDSFQFRGDTLFVLAELVQDYMIRALHEAHNVSIDVAEATGQYPALTKRLLERHGRPLVRELDLIQFSIFHGRNASIEAASELLKDEDCGTVRDRIIRRLSRRAGIVRMDSEAYDFAWVLLIHLIFWLIRPACIDMIENYREPPSVGTRTRRTRKKRKLVGNETIRMIPPLSTSKNCNCCRSGLKYTHTIVPRQIEDAVQSVFEGRFPARVYGNFWLVPDPIEGSQQWFEATDREVDEAETEYEYEYEDDEVAITVGPCSEEIEMAIDHDDVDDESDTWSVVDDDEISSPEADTLSMLGDESDSGNDSTSEDEIAGDDFDDSDDDDDDSDAEGRRELFMFLGFIHEQVMQE